MRNFSQRERKIAVALILVIGVYGLFQGIYIPYKNKKETLNKRILTTQKKFKKNLVTIKKSEMLETKYRPILENFKQRGSDDQVMSAILAEIEGVATQVNMRIADMKPKRVRQVDFYNHFSVSLAVDASLVDVMHFIYVLQTSPHMFEIEELNLNNNAGRPDTPLRCQMVLSRLLIP